MTAKNQAHPMSSVAQIARRRFLLGLGGSLALPFLPSIMGKSFAGVPGAGPPKRFILLSSANGQRPETWFPRTPQSWRILSSTAPAREAALSGTGGISTVLGPEFDALKPKLLLIRGLDFIQRFGGGHFPPCILSGNLHGDSRNGENDSMRGVTIDQVMAQSSAVYPTPPAVRSLQLLVQGPQSAYPNASTANVGGVMVDNTPETQCSVTYNRLFGDFSITPDPLETKRTALRANIVDRVRGDYELLRSSPKLGAEDKARLDAHVTMLHDLQARIGAQGIAAGCRVPSTPVDLDQNNSLNIPALTTTNIDLLVAAIKCDRTRIATFMLSPNTDTRFFDFIRQGPLSDSHHGLSHLVYGDTYAQSIPKLAIINNWYAKQVADLLTKLDVVEDPLTGRTFLDTSLVYWGNEDGSWAHEHWGMQVLLAGSCGGYFKTGRYLDFRHVTTRPDGTETGTKIQVDYQGTPIPYGNEYLGRPYNSLLITIMQAMGLAPADYEAPGQPGFGDYTDNVANQYSISDGQKALPFVTA